MSDLEDNSLSFINCTGAVSGEHAMQQGFRTQVQIIEEFFSGVMGRAHDSMILSRWFMNVYVIASKRCNS